MTDRDELVEKVARAIADYELPVGPGWQDRWRDYLGTADAAIALMRPVIRAEALEEAARVVTEHYQELSAEHRLLLLNRAAAIEALILPLPKETSE